MEQIKAYFGYTEAAEDTAKTIAAAYKKAGFGILLGKGDFVSCEKAAKKAFCSHLLYFTDPKNLLFSLLSGEMAGFTAELPVAELVLPNS